MQSHERNKEHFLKNTEQHNVNMEVVMIKKDEAKIRNNGGADPKQRFIIECWLRSHVILKMEIGIKNNLNQNDSLTSSWQLSIKKGISRT